LHFVSQSAHPVYVDFAQIVHNPRWIRSCVRSNLD
jgi:hypothetical protein